MQSLLISSLLVGASALNIPAAALSRRAAVNAGAAALAGLAPFAATAAAKVPEKESKLVKSTAAELKTVLENKESFITDLANGVEGSGKLPAPIPFTTFQKLEATADPEFMEAAIDYAEAFRGAKDLVKLAKLAKSKVMVTTKEAGKPMVKDEMNYADAPGSGLSSAEEYAKRAANELVGASVALDAAVKFMGS